jgi:N-acylneuraminate cytidylyltransferase
LTEIDGGCVTSLGAADRAIALIPARGGSKGIPRKNLREVAGKPLVAWSIEQALAAREFTEVVVSTEDDEIAEVASEWGAQVLRRPLSLALDSTPTSAVIAHALCAFEGRCDVVCLLEPTSPLRTLGDIVSSVRLLARHPGAVVASVHFSREVPELIFEYGDDGMMRDTWTGTRATRRQVRPEYVALNGLVYTSRMSTLSESAELRDHPMVGFLVEEDRAISIDTEVQLQIVNERLLRDSLTSTLKEIETNP